MTAEEGGSASKYLMELADQIARAQAWRDYKEVRRLITLGISYLEEYLRVRR